MKMKLLFGSFLISVMFLIGCSTPSGTTVKGTIENASNLSVYFDKKDFSQTINSLEKADTDGNGSFSFNFPEGLAAGHYRVRVGTKALDLVFDGSEKMVDVSGDLNFLQTMDYKVDGSPLSSEFQSTLYNFVEKTTSQTDLQNYMVQTGDPLISSALAMTIFGTNPSTAAFHRSVSDRLTEKYADLPVSKEYEAFVKTVEQSAKQATASSSRGKYSVNVGDTAPEISLPDLNGRKRALSDLKGNIVLIDFWASWCGPCRRANPSVVKTYDKYKDDGFTVFSVSLDGLDDRTKSRFGGKQDLIDQQMASSKKRWKDAIAKDKLTWDYHVSDLKKWDSDAAASYGVRSIPTTFLLDRDGKIAALNPKHQTLENEIKKLL